MSETDNKSKGTLTIGPSRLSLTKTVEGGQVKQNFQRGRSKTVTVEVRKTRTFSRDGGEMVRDKNSILDSDGLNAKEREARMRALQQMTEAQNSQTTARVEPPIQSGVVIKERAEKSDVVRPVVVEEPKPEPVVVVEAKEEPIPAPQPSQPTSSGHQASQIGHQGGKADRPPVLKAPKRNPSPSVVLSPLLTARNNANNPNANANNAAATPATPAKKPDVVRAAPKMTDGEDDAANGKVKGDRTQKMKLVRDDADRRLNRLTVTQALSMGDDQRMRSLASLKRQREKARKGEDLVKEKVVRDVVIPETITVQELANRMSERAVDVVKSLMKMGTMVTVNQSIDADTAEIIVEEFGHRHKRVSDSDVERAVTDQHVQEDEGNLKPRPPVVTVMGHVDHGKTSLLDALRKTDVAAGEAGGITQHIGAYQVRMATGDKITFIDTPGHEAFTAMRARGAKVTDIVVLVVAADDGIMPQTEEAISHARAAKVPIVVAVNKIDKPDADPARIKTDLTNYELVAEEFGGDVMVVEVSAKQGLHLDKLEEAILLTAEMLELRANPDRAASGVVIESKIEQGRGTVATLLLQKGTLRVGDIVVAGAATGRVRAMINDRGENIKEAGPSMPVEILGLNEPPEAGDEFGVVVDEKTARDITSYRTQKQRDARAISGAKTMEQLFAAAGKEQVKELPVIIKADVQGSAEALAASLMKFADDEVTVRIIHSAVGAISESDVSLAQTTGASLIGFNVRASKQAKEMADKEKVDIRYYSIIYDVVDDVKAALSGLLSPRRQETFIGYASVREIFNVTKVGKVAGCMVTDGLVKRGAGVRLLRDNVVIHEGTLKTLKRFKDDVKEVKSGYECGMAFENYDDLKAGDVIEAFEVQEVARVVGDAAKNTGKGA
jgi:translation initiation factor IF-2